MRMRSWGGVLVTATLVACSPPPDPVEPAAEAACSALAADASPTLRPPLPSQLVYEATQDPALTADQRSRLDAAVREQCPDELRVRGEEFQAYLDADAAEVEAEKAETTQDFVARYVDAVALDDYDEDQRAAVLVIADTWCESGASKHVPIHLLARASVDGLESLGEWMQGQYALAEFVPDWQQRPEVLAAIRLLPVVEGAGHPETRMPSAVAPVHRHWREATLRYCRATEQIDY